MVTTPHSTEIRFTYRIAPVYHLQNIRVCNTRKYSFETPFLDYLDFVRQIFRQVGVPYRTSIFNCWSDPRYINTNQIDLIDSTTFQLTTQIMLNFYKAVIESVLTFSITVWFGSVTVKEKLRLNRVVNTASKIIGRSLPSLESLYQQRLLRRAGLISQNPSHPAHDLFEPLPSSRRFRSIKTRTSRFSNSFYPVAVQALSKQT